MTATGMPLAWRRRAHASYAAFLVHRLSGVLLALFLPVHFWALGRAIEGAASLQGFLDWAENPLVKLAESGLVILLALHLAGGLRLLAVEFAGWRDWQRTAIAAGFGFGLALGLLYLLNAGLGG
jgi:fumarate reductase subunit D